MFAQLNQGPHRRFNPLTGEWVLVSPHRTQRPWQGKQEDVAGSGRPAFDENCYLCPGNKRSNGQQNPDYTQTFVFTNDFSALLMDTPDLAMNTDPLFQAVSERGMCKVICFSPHHDLSVPNMSVAAVTRVIEVWKNEYESLQANPDISYAQIFENKGAIMGCSNPHPHCQIWASSSIPPIVVQEQVNQHRYAERQGNPMLLDYLNRELERKTRVVYENEQFVAVVPFWAVWPFEAMILPRRHIPSIDQFSGEEARGFADAYRRLTQAYDQVFRCEFPYTAGIHQAPTTAENHDHWQLHMHFYPPLLRSATVKKFMVGYEMLAAPQRDITAESAAETLRNALNQAEQE
ncbi:MAG: UDP-glucose--hexose-1-phosphate uridylyltransferase [Xanthomonadales bacterium]|jgi:UDPglucose--hexose-1-phosphate uridylyltransferase|nr:UDP-glucose--hexose-1-phosphate uridylyltransferase [Xanthomonadales bacterium]